MPARMQPGGRVGSNGGAPAEDPCRIRIRFAAAAVLCWTDGCGAAAYALSPSRPFLQNGINSYARVSMESTRCSRKRILAGCVVQFPEGI